MTATPGRRRRPRRAAARPAPWPARTGRAGPRPRRRRLLEQRAEDALVAGERAGVGAGRGRARARVAPAFSTATPMPAASAALERGAPARAVAVGLEVEGDARTPSRSASAPRKSAASSTAWLPQDTTVCSPSPRREARALTATLPLCEITATGPGSRGADRVAPQRDAVGQRDDPVAVRARTPACRPRPPRARACSAAPPRASANPAANTTAPPQPSAPRLARPRPARPRPGSPTTTASGASGSAVERRIRPHAVHRVAPRVDRIHAPGIAQPRRGSAAPRRRTTPPAPTPRPPPRTPAATTAPT